LIAEDVAAVNPDLVAYDYEGKPISLRYLNIKAMLLNEFLKEHKAFVEQQRKLEQQGATIARQQKQIDALTAGLQKVSAQLEISKSATRTALNSNLLPF
jgi:replication fork clamp-binding protein CrfC